MPDTIAKLTLEMMEGARRNMSNDAWRRLMEDSAHMYETEGQKDVADALRKRLAEVSP